MKNNNINLGNIRIKQGNTVFILLNAAAFIKYFVIRVRRLFEGGVYTRAAFI